jgi:hypothetical protein
MGRSAASVCTTLRHSPLTDGLPRPPYVARYRAYLGFRRRRAPMRDQISHARIPQQASNVSPETLGVSPRAGKPLLCLYGQAFSSPPQQ